MSVLLGTRGDINNNDNGGDKSVSGLRKLTRLVNNNTQCMTCGKSYKNRQGLLKHLRINLAHKPAVALRKKNTTLSGLGSCAITGTVTGCNSGGTVPEIKSIKCVRCQLQFNDRWTLGRHMDERRCILPPHCYERPWTASERAAPGRRRREAARVFLCPCADCQMRFPSWTPLRRHLEGDHPGYTPGAFTCAHSKCFLEFSSALPLREHQASKHGIQEYSVLRGQRDYECERIAIVRNDSGDASFVTGSSTNVCLDVATGIVASKAWSAAPGVLWARTQLKHPPVEWMQGSAAVSRLTAAEAAASLAAVANGSVAGCMDISDDDRLRLAKMGVEPERWLTTDTTCSKCVDGFAIRSTEDNHTDRTRARAWSCLCWRACAGRSNNMQSLALTEDLWNERKREHFEECARQFMMRKRREWRQGRARCVMDEVERSSKTPYGVVSFLSGHFRAGQNFNARTREERALLYILPRNYARYVWVGDVRRVDDVGTIFGMVSDSAAMANMDDYQWTDEWGDDERRCVVNIRHRGRPKKGQPRAVMPVAISKIKKDYRRRRCGGSMSDRVSVTKRRRVDDRSDDVAIAARC